MAGEDELFRYHRRRETCLWPETMAVWCWIDDGLKRLSAHRIDVGGLKAVCATVMELEAPTACAHAYALGISLDSLLVARMGDVYRERYGRPVGGYLLIALRRVAQELMEDSQIGT